MPGYPFLARPRSIPTTIADHLRTLAAVGVPYTDDQIANAGADLKAQADPDNAGSDAFAQALRRRPSCAISTASPARRPRWTR